MNSSIRQNPVFSSTRIDAVLSEKQKAPTVLSPYLAQEKPLKRAINSKYYLIKRENNAIMQVVEK